MSHIKDNYNIVNNYSESLADMLVEHAYRKNRQRILDQLLLDEPKEAGKIMYLELEYLLKETADRVQDYAKEETE